MACRERCELRCVLLICILASGLGGRQLPFQLGAHSRLSNEPFLESGLPLRGCSQIGGGTLLLLLRLGLDGRQFVFHLAADRDRLGQGSTQLRLPARQPIRGRGDVRTPIAARLFEVAIALASCRSTAAR